MPQQRKSKPTKTSRTGEVAAVSAGLVAVAAATYYFLGPKGARHRKQLKSWSIQMKGEVIEKLERLEKVSEPVYRSIVDAVAAKYARESGLARREVEALAEDLKRSWRSIASTGATRREKAPTRAQKTKKGTQASRERSSKRARSTRTRKTKNA